MPSCPPASALLHPLLSTSRDMRSDAFPCGTRAADLHKHGGRYWDRTSDLLRVRHRKLRCLGVRVARIPQISGPAAESRGTGFHAAPNNSVPEAGATRPG